MAVFAHGGQGKPTQACGEHGKPRRRAPNWTEIQKLCLTGACVNYFPLSFTAAHNPDIWKLKKRQSRGAPRGELPLQENQMGSSVVEEMH